MVHTANEQCSRSELRAVLRAATRAAHDRVDAAFGRYDLTDRRDYARFLHAHYDALFDLDGVAAPSGLPPLALRGPLMADLAALGVSPVRASPPPRMTDEAFRLGCYYVLAGSQAGARVLQRQWAQSADPLVLSAGRYLDAGARAQAWAAFRRFDPPADMDMTRAVTGAMAAFEVFHAAALRHDTDKRLTRP